MKLNFHAVTRNAVTTLLSVASSLGLAGAALALPSFGGNCASCHGDAREAFDITRFNGTANPVGGIGVLKYIDALAGTSVQLTANVYNGTPSYAVTLVDVYANPNLRLAQAPGSSWTFETSGPDQFFFGPSNANAAHTFALAVPASTPAGFYPLTFTVAGYDRILYWAHSESFYVRVVPEVGTLLLLSVGLGTIGLVARRRRRR